MSSLKDAVLEAVDKAADGYGVSREEYLGAVAGQFIGYVIYRKRGAPKWAAWGLSAIQAQLALMVKGANNDREWYIFADEEV